MSYKIKEKELRQLRECCELNVCPTINPKTLSVLLDKYEENERLKEIIYKVNGPKMQNINEIGV